MNKRPYPSSIEEAAKQLDICHPRWWTKIDTRNLWMRNSNKCILGQLYDTYDAGMKLYDVTVYDVSVYSVVHDSIFGLNASADKWKEQIAMRNVGQIKMCSHDIHWALQQLAEGKRVKRPQDMVAYFVKNGSLCTDNCGGVNFPYAYLIATDWMLDETVTLAHLSPGETFVFNGNNYVCCQREGSMIYCVHNNTVCKLSDDRRVQRG